MHLYVCVLASLCLRVCACVCVCARVPPPLPTPSLTFHESMTKLKVTKLKVLFVNAFCFVNSYDEVMTTMKVGEITKPKSTLD